ncbi:DUF1428 domain-containing protein [Martelella radicis]|uniref:Uncharacterized protein YbaA (DUF1428 family) n=1 Tax=Martelella radicis TaxID=1397476 RepID=A0A7W6KLW1_9HYPH|nr:DUF1428 domain-containing protein [Martelella radicis]MBB4122524.1 uncharacterized protein YbaA (DUF1428 family) [Martelella radicis]
MTYVDGFLAPVPVENREAYYALCQKAAAKFKAHGALSYVECWEEDVPDGKVTSFNMALKKKGGEAVVFSWVVWPSKDARNAAWGALMNDPEMNEMPFDGARMVYGGFDLLFAENGPVAATAGSA